MNSDVENRIVVLLKSLRTNNRFYALVPEESGYRNADAIDGFPPDMLLGIAYPCLEDGLNDFAVIRTTFETIEVFPDDAELRAEMMEIIADARSKLVLRLTELRDGVVAGQIHFLGTVLQEFKDHMMHVARRGAIRRTLDNMMKLDVFESVCKADAARTGQPPDPMYRYQFLPGLPLEEVDALGPRLFIGRLLDDVLRAVQDDANYRDRHGFDREVFQKFVAVMFTNYATTDPVFYGTNRDDYGVSSDKDMNATPLYQAVARELRRIEVEIAQGRMDAGREARVAAPEPLVEEAPDLSHLFSEASTDLFEPVQAASHLVEIPFGAAERMLVQPLSRLKEVVRLLAHLDHPRAGELSAMATAAGQEIFRGLKELQIVSPLAGDPFNGDGSG